MILSRVADALYWMSRYLERAEHTARLVDIRVDLALDHLPGTREWNFERLYGSLQLPEVGLATTPAALTQSFFFDHTNRASVIACVTAARENARQVREEISADMWEQINRLFLRLRQMRTENLTRPHHVSRLVIEGVHLFQGITDATLGHGEGWHYLQAGRFIERTGATAMLLDRYLSDGPLPVGPVTTKSDHGEWVALLRSTSALEAYCRHYTADLRRDRIAEFLLLNSTFPKSVRFAAARLGDSLRALAEFSPRGAKGRAVRLAGRLHASLDFGQVDEILGDDPHEYLENIARQCDEIHGAVYQSYVRYPIESAVPA